jgi:NADPH:quinone reductase-like Zn-dependent oxidoreductase
MTGQHTMRAYTVDRYGGPEVLQSSDVARPVPRAGEVVVDVAATSVNPLDWHELRGEPWIARGRHLRRPGARIRGTDIAGTVSSVGDGVDSVHLGDRVVGTAVGAFAEQAVTRPGRITSAPTTVDLVVAAALPVAGVTALQAVRAARVDAGDRVLVVGASGGVGTFAVQLLARTGVEVTAVCSAANVELVSDLGASHVVAYDDAGLGSLHGPFTAIIDAVGSIPLRRSRRLLAPRGRMVVVGGPDGGRLIGPLSHLLRATIVFSATWIVGRRRAVPMLARLTRDDLATLVAMVDAGELRPVLDRVVEFERLPEAVSFVETRRARGKVIVDIAGAVR